MSDDITASPMYRALEQIKNLKEPQPKSQMSETEVKACPFCGAPATADVDLDNELTIGCGTAKCPGNSAVFCWDNTQEAYDAWNTRATDTENQRLREALEAADKMILHHCNPEEPCVFRGDWACAECKPHSEIIKPGFRCAFHAAKERMDTAPVKALNPEGGAE